MTKQTDFNTRLRHCLHEAGWTQEKLAKRLNLSQGAVSHYFSGLRKPPSDHLITIAETFSVSLDWLLTGEGPKEKSRPSQWTPFGPADIEFQASTDRLADPKLFQRLYEVVLASSESLNRLKLDGEAERLSLTLMLYKGFETVTYEQIGRSLKMADRVLIATVIGLDAFMEYSARVLKPTEKRDILLSLVDLMSEITFREVEQREPVSTASKSV
ncbi:MAG: helix-turn-helix transcriptional regulator [Magnetococcales bacterium]|nr:helix-turn-helix transcriptional regulator [Magnetococcales bacterium]